MLLSCRDRLEVYRIQRLGIFSYSTDQLNTSFANAISFYRGKTVLYNYPGQSVLYTRYLLEAKGKNQTGRNVTISIEVDLVDDGTYIDVFKPTYEIPVGGIHSFNYLEEASAGVYKSYSLDPAFLSDTYFRVQRQNQEERLILDDFLAHLQNDLSATEKLVLYEGSFKDISYVLD
ncbi:MAG: hypothetical protein K2U26_14285 [Cyclobacteriaceae bacterium]|nr:hypothetical protein [Cyclobacteriaceae bacterium]